MNTPKSFEETYPRYPFAALVHLAVGLSRMIKRVYAAYRAATSKILPA